MRTHFLYAALIAATVPTFAAAQCRMSVPGASCIVAPQSTTPKPGPVEIGQTLDRGEYSMLMNPRYYGLPAVSDGWVYMKIEDDIYQVDWRSHRVLARVTDKAGRNW